MNITVVLEQMIIILFLILTGVFLFRKKMISEETSRQISGLIINVTNPALLICSAFGDTPKVSLQELGLGALVFLSAYIVLILAAYLIPLLLRVPDHARYSYHMLTVFGNVGFIGIPLASAVLGSGSLIFVSMSNLLYNILIYTYGMSVLRKAAVRQGTYRSEEHSESPLKKIINVGTVSAMLTLIFYLADFPVPIVISSTLNYAGRSTTLLSMLVLGVSVAQMAIRDIFSNPRLYLYVAIRQIALPVVFTLVLSLFIKHPLILNASALMLAVPSGNMPLMLSKQFGTDESTISQGIILSTLLSLVTIPIVVWIL